MSRLERYIEARLGDMQQRLDSANESNAELRSRLDRRDATIGELLRQRDQAIGERDEANARLRWRAERADNEHGDLRGMLQRVLEEPSLDPTLRSGIERLLANPVG